MGTNGSVSSTFVLPLITTWAVPGASGAGDVPVMADEGEGLAGSTVDFVSAASAVRVGPSRSVVATTPRLSIVSSASGMSVARETGRCSVTVILHCVSRSCAARAPGAD